MRYNTGSGKVRIGACVTMLGSAGWATLSVISALSAFGPAPAKASANTLIDLTYDSVMDMVRPEVHHNLQITVSGQKNLAEDRNRSAGPYHDQNSMMQVLSSSGEQ